MSKSRVSITAGAVFLSAALAVNLFSSPSKTTNITTQRTTAPADLTPEQVLTWDCETTEFKPEILMIMCADGGIYVEKIQWDSWSQEGATGLGIYSENLCEPNCAEGKRVTASVNLTLSNLTEQNGKYYLRTLEMSSVGGKGFPRSNAYSFQWDVMEFAEMVTGN